MPHKELIHHSKPFTVYRLQDCWREKKCVGRESKHAGDKERLLLEFITSRRPPNDGAKSAVHFTSNFKGLDKRLTFGVTYGSIVRGAWFIQSILDEFKDRGLDPRRNVQITYLEPFTAINGLVLSIQLRIDGHAISGHWVRGYVAASNRVKMRDDFLPKSSHRDPFHPGFRASLDLVPRRQRRIRRNTVIVQWSQTESNVSVVPSISVTGL
ncbi:hypothetical protein Btru_026579 [Bulinus truncatus]|nr:hypothetical protein Btru_026579 [Bulinus truncatus]